ncbi:MAG: beta-lactamase family protein [Deltaproteobacteria bacterium]|nr:beta-lactamase family protein [Deltaproteobacteria bacterium]
MMRISLRIIFAALFSIFLCLVPQDLRAFDAHITDDKLFAARMEELLKMYNIPSVSACILKKDKRGIWDIAWEGVYGYRVALWPRIKAGQGTIYAIGSITKTFTATAVMQLVEKGLIDLDADINAYMPFSIKNPGLNYGDPTNPVPPITVRQLLSHCSGLSLTPFTFFSRHGDLADLDFGVFMNIDELREYLSKKDAWAHENPDAQGKKVYYRPGERYCYSNVGYLILGFLIEEVINRDGSSKEGGSGKPCKTWMDYIKENILKPLGMKDTEFYWSGYPWGSKAQGYIEKRFVNQINPDYPLDPSGELQPGPAYYAEGVPMPRYILVPQRPAVRNPTIGILYNTGGAAGQMKSTARDLAYFMTVHLNKGKGYKRDRKGHIIYDKKRRPVQVPILSSRSIRAMHNFDDSKVIEPSKLDSEPGLSRVIGYGLGWMRANWGGRYWNYPWNPDRYPRRGVNWAELRPYGIIPEPITKVNGVDVGGGLNVEGHGGDLPGYHAEMYRVSENLAIICLMSENFSEERRDESRMQPKRFKHYKTAYDGASELKDFDGAFPHHLVKYSEIQYLLLQKAASLN